MYLHIINKNMYMKNFCFLVLKYKYYAFDCLTTLSTHTTYHRLHTHLPHSGNRCTARRAFRILGPSDVGPCNDRFALVNMPAVHTDVHRLTQ